MRIVRAPWVVIAGGGTAGHVLPAIAVALELVDEGCPREAIRFVGSERGIEKRLVPEAGFDVTLLSGRGIQRSLSATATMANVRAIAGLAVGFARALASMARARPAVVLSMGGFASVPSTAAAVLVRVPIVLAESNAKAGAANRMVARFAAASAVAFTGTGLPRGVLTGNPVRQAIAAIAHEDRDEARRVARAALGVGADTSFVSVFGGSLGARRLNDAVFDALDAWEDRALVVHHIVGDTAWEEASRRAQAWRDAHAAAVIDHRVVRYEDRMDLVYAAADVAVCRAGATSIADLCAVGLPAVLVPLPTSAGDHQSLNAGTLAAEGAAVHVPDVELDAARLVREVDSLLGDGGRRSRMVDAQRARARPDAAAAIVALLRRHARRPPTVEHMSEGDG